MLQSRTMHAGKTFFRLMAVCSGAAASAVLLAQTVLARYPHPSSAETAIALYADPTFRAQSWVILLQVFLMFLALWGVTVKMHRQAPALTITGFVFFALWQILELIPRSVDLFAGSHTWAPAYLAASDEATRALIVERFHLLDAAAGALREVRRPLWALGHLLFGIAVWNARGWKRLIPLFFLLNGLRLILGMVAAGGGVFSLLGGGALVFMMLMVPLFALIAVWLWVEPELCSDGTSPAAARASDAAARV